MSMGPLDKSKALQEQDLLQDMLSAPQRPIPSPVQQTFQMFEEKQPIFKIGKGLALYRISLANEIPRFFEVS